MKRAKLKTWRPAGSAVFVFMLMISCSFMASSVAGQDSVKQETIEQHQQEIESWRARRHKRLLEPDGWMSLVGLEWLEEGENSIGSGADNDIRLTGGPAYWGSVFLEDNQLRFTTASDGSVHINDEILEQAKLVPDSEGQPTLVSSGTLSFYVIFRGSYGLRVKDSQAEALRNFKGVPNYLIDETWRIKGDFIRSEEGATIEVANVLGQVNESPVFGTFKFEKDGKTHKLMGIGTAESKSLWFIFADRTSGRGSYGAGRFLYSDGMPAGGHLTVDFNKAYNPPCAFNAFSTCPLPPQQNRLDVMVTAGEKDFHPET